MTEPANPQKAAARESSATQIRWCVFTLASGMWGLYTLMGHSYGVPYPRAFVIGFWSALGGFLVWWVYHLASGRNNGAITLIFVGPFSDDFYRDTDYRYGIARKILVGTVNFLGFGLYCRRPFFERLTSRLRKSH